MTSKSNNDTAAGMGGCTVVLMMAGALLLLNGILLLARGSAWGSLLLAIGIGANLLNAFRLSQRRTARRGGDDDRP